MKLRDLPNFCANPNSYWIISSEVRIESYNEVYWSVATQEFNTKMSPGSSLLRLWSRNNIKYEENHAVCSIKYIEAQTTGNSKNLIF